MKDTQFKDRMEQIHQEQVQKYHQMIYELHVLRLKKDEIDRQITDAQRFISNFELQFDVLQQIKQIIDQEVGKPEDQVEDGDIDLEVDATQEDEQIH